MMTDIVERLREWVDDGADETCREAADEIECLRDIIKRNGLGEIERLRASRQWQPTDIVEYDLGCLDLARAFLADTPEINNEHSRDRLASAIQKAIEDEMQRLESPCPVCRDLIGKGCGHDH